MSRSVGKRRVIFAAGVLGFGLSGFFDGILLHQVLQWHHLLSLVPGETFRRIETQILADGLFHVLMYVITAAGLFLLWRARHWFGTGEVSWRSVAGGGLLGFGLWNVVDVGLFHWVLRIHRLRVDVPDPMLYDVAWIMILGLLPLLVGWLLMRGEQPGRGEGGRGAAALLGVLALTAAPIASLPAPDTSTAVVLFASGSPVRGFQAALAAEASVLWMSADGRMMAVQADTPGATFKLYQAGATLVTRSPALAGCAVAVRI